jgi:REP element-mobilizing transposase RayT
LCSWYTREFYVDVINRPVGAILDANTPFGREGAIGQWRLREIPRYSPAKHEYTRTIGNISTIIPVRDVTRIHSSHFREGAIGPGKAPLANGAFPGESNGEFLAAPMHRNSQKRYYIPGAAYFITTVTHGRYPYFEADILRDVFICEMFICRSMRPFTLYGYAIMPDHVHLLIRPDEGHSYSKIMQFIKRHFTRNANYVLGYSDDVEYPVKASLTVKAPLANGAFTGFPVFPDGKWTGVLTRYRAAYAVQHPDRLHPPFKWQKSYHDHVIRDRVDFFRHMGYIKRQHEKHGACGDAWVGDGL